MAEEKLPDTETDINTDASAKKVSGSFKNLLQVLANFFKDRLSILDNAQPEKTIEGIEKDIEFRGFNLWILIPAILIASVGLNANSTAVIIGAMLISPLMGPIIGLGLSVGINDFSMLKRSLRNLGIAVGVSIITSTLFFLAIPINDASSELLARTQPDIRDVFIAFFGGFAGILAGSRREKSNVIPGVAIATALMPPLCTAGYGLATWQLKYFLGASYLFLINAFFIALASVLVVRYLRYPLKKFVDEQTHRKAKYWLSLTVIVMIIPASIIFINVVQDSLFLRKANSFIDDRIHYGDGEIVKQDIIITDSANYINLVIFGERIPNKAIANWQNELNAIVDNTILRVFQGSDRGSMPEIEKLVDMYTTSQSQMATKDQTINSLKQAIRQYQEGVLPPRLLDEIKINYPEVKAVKMGRMMYSDFSGKQISEEPNFFVKWQGETHDSIQKSRINQLQNWLATRLMEDSVTVSSFD